MDARTSCIVNSCQGNVAGVLFYSFHQHALALEVIHVICFDGIRTIINPGKLNSIPCMYTTAPSWTVSR